MKCPETTMNLWAVAVAAILAAGPATAGEVYRCAGNVYQSERCAGGQEIDIDLERNVVAAENRRPVAPPPSGDRERREVVVIHEAAPPPPPEIVREPVYIWPSHVRPHPQFRAHPHFRSHPQFQAHPQHRRHRDAERPKPRAREDVGRPAYGYRPGG